MYWRSCKGSRRGALDPDRDEIVVYWNGKLGPDAEAAVTEAGQRGVPVRVIRVAYSYDELHQIIGRLIESLQVRGIAVEGYRIGDPFDEVAVWGRGLDESADARETVAAMAAETLPADLKLAVIISPDPLVAADSRHEDGGQPTPGGGFQVGGTGGVYCTSGLGWEDPGFRFYMESAAHCVDFENDEWVAFEGNPYNADTYSGYIGTLVGNPNIVSSSDWLLDATLIGVPNTPSIAGEMFTGSKTSSTKQDIPSIGTIALNTPLCANGAATGTHCNVQRTSAAVNRMQICAGGSVCRWFDVVPVYSTDSGLLFGQGDSGGNIYRLSDRRVVGTISALHADVFCGSANYWNPEFLCSLTSGFVTEVSKVASELAETNPDLEPRLRP